MYPVDHSRHRGSSFTPWRLEIPFMGHWIDWIESGDLLTGGLRGYYLYGT